MQFQRKGIKQRVLWEEGQNEENKKTKNPWKHMLMWHFNCWTKYFFTLSYPSVHFQNVIFRIFDLFELHLFSFLIVVCSWKKTCMCRLASNASQAEEEIPPNYGIHRGWLVKYLYIIKIYWIFVLCLKILRNLAVCLNSKYIVTSSGKHKI